MSRSYSKDVAPDRSTLRTVFRDTFRSRAISLIVLPLMKCSRRIRPIVSTVSIPPPPAWNQSEQRIRPTCRGSILDADPPAQGVKIARRMTIMNINTPLRADESKESLEVEGRRIFRELARAQAESGDSKRRPTILPCC